MKGFRVLLGVVAMAVVIVGCAPKGSYPQETVDDGETVVHTVPGYDVMFPIPDDAAAAEAMSGSAGQVYVHEEGGYTLSVEVLQADSPDAMLQRLTGLNPDHLTVMTTWQGNMPRYDLAWTCAGETGLLVCQAAVIDDGSYFYAVSAQIPETFCAQYGELVASCLADVRLTENTDSMFTAP